MRFQLVDTVLEQDETRIVTVKAVTAAEEYLADHFPSFPVLPGVMMLEAMVQAARRLLAERTDQRFVLAEARNIRYGNMVRPGQRLRVSVEHAGERDGLVAFRGQAEVDEQQAVNGRFTLRPLAADAR